jgi:glucose/arabinose dehydrogenase
MKNVSIGKAFFSARCVTNALGTLLLGSMALSATFVVGQQVTVPPSTEGSSAQPDSKKTSDAVHGWRHFPVYARVEGQPIDSRAPEKADDKPLFPQQTRAPFHATAPYKVETLASTLHAPWAVAFLPDGKILVTEKLPGTLRILDAEHALSAPLAGLKAVSSAPEFGVLDLALDPHFATNHLLFFTFFDWIDGNAGNTNVARARLDEGENTLRDVKVIFRTSPAIPTVGNLSAATKTGGRIAIGKDDTLFVTIGDRDGAGPAPWDVAQKLDNDLGKIIHITPDGKPAPDNPYLHTPGALPEIWAIGQRSQEGLAFDPATGKLWETEHGPRGGDELNLIEPGKNYGWPLITHGIDYGGRPVGAGITALDGMEQPVYYWDPVIAPSGLAFYQGELFPAWKNSVFVGGLGGMLLDRLTMSGGRVVNEEALLTDLHSRIRDVRVGPDGAVYVLTDSGTALLQDNTPPTSRLLKLTPQ